MRRDIDTRFGGPGAWSADDFADRPAGRRRIFLRVEVPHVGATLDAEQVTAADPHTWRVQTHDATGWRTAEGVHVDNPEDLLGTVAILLAAVRDIPDPPVSKP